MNESVTVRSEERAIYTHSRNLTIQIYVRSSDANLRTSDLNRKHYSCRVRSLHEQVNVATPDKCRDFRRLGIPMYVGTSNVHRQPTRNTRCLDSRHGSGLPAVGSSNIRRDFRRAQTAGHQNLRCRDFRLSGVPTYVGTSDGQSHYAGLVTGH